MKTFLSSCLLLVILSPAGLGALEAGTSSASQETSSAEFTQEAIMHVDTAEVKRMACVLKREDRNIAHNTCTVIGGSCFNRITITHFNGSENIYKEQGCDEDCTSTNYTFTTVDKQYIQGIYKCCQKNLCNYMKHEESTRHLNGLECPNFCVSGSAASEGSNAIPCHNEETQCIEFVLVHDDSEVPDEVVKGCATPAFCDLAKTSRLNKYFKGTITKA